MKGFYLHVMPALLYAAAVFYAGSVPLPHGPELGDIPSDKLAHSIVFAGMQLALFRAVRWARPEASFRGHLLISAMLASGIGAGLEFWQAALPHRSAEFMDWIADTGGVLVGVAVRAFVLRGADESVEGSHGESS